MCFGRFDLRVNVCRRAKRRLGQTTQRKLSTLPTAGPSTSSKQTVLNPWGPAQLAMSNGSTPSMCTALQPLLDARAHPCADHQHDLRLLVRERPRSLGQRRHTRTPQLVVPQVGQYPLVQASIALRGGNSVWWATRQTARSGRERRGGSRHAANLAPCPCRLTHPWGAPQPQLRTRANLHLCKLQERATSLVAQRVMGCSVGTRPPVCDRNTMCVL